MRIKIGTFLARIFENYIHCKIAKASKLLKMTKGVPKYLT